MGKKFLLQVNCEPFLIIFMIIMEEPMAQV